MEENKEIQIRRIDELQEEFSKVFLIADKGIIPLLCATVIANQMDLDPVWLFLISPSSGGKTEFIESFENVSLRGKPMCFPISDLTVNTFASGQSKAGKETSLLHKMSPGSIMVFKDFTSMIAKQDDAQKAIMSQLREIYDQKYVKRTGTGKDIVWQGKVGAIAGCTEVIYESNEQFAVMGDRFIMYKMVQPERMDVLRFVLKSSKDKDNNFKAKKTYLKNCMKSYVEFCIENIENTVLELDPAMEEDLLNVVNFATMVSSGVMVDKRKGTVEFVPSHTMPMRMAKQLLGLAQAFVLMNKQEPALGKNSPLQAGHLKQSQIEILYKVAFDTIPAKRRMALRILAKFNYGSSTAGIATILEYQTPVVAGWLAQLNALGICRREKNGGAADKWFLKDEWKDIMVKFEHIETIDKSLEGEGNDEDYGEAWGGRDEYKSQTYTPSGVPKDDFEKTEQEIDNETIFNQLGAKEKDEFGGL